MEPKDRIIVPLDVSDVEEAKRLVDMLSPHVGLFKIGLEFIWSSIASLILLPEREAIDLLKKIRALTLAMGGERVFIDAKLDDIPNTVKGASVAISSMGVNMFNIHASAGEESIRAAAAAKGNSMLLGVTVLTSIGEEECVSIFGDNPAKKVVQFARMLHAVGASGIICSPKELEPISNALIPAGFKKVTPGIRPKWAVTGDQKRVMTVTEAMKAGADYMVIGRPIRKPPAEIGTPVDAAKRIADEIASAF